MILKSRENATKRTLETETKRMLDRLNTISENALNGCNVLISIMHSNCDKGDLNI